MAHTVTTKGQVTIPKKFRERLGIKPGSAVEFDLTDAGEVVLRSVDRRSGRQGAHASPHGRFAKMRGRATVKMRTEEILALTRGR